MLVTYVQRHTSQNHRYYYTGQSHAKRDAPERPEAEFPPPIRLSRRRGFHAVATLRRRDRGRSITLLSWDDGFLLFGFDGISSAVAIFGREHAVHLFCCGSKLLPRALLVWRCLEGVGATIACVSRGGKLTRLGRDLIEGKFQRG